MLLLSAPACRFFASGLVVVFLESGVLVDLELSSPNLPYCDLCGERVDEDPEDDNTADDIDDVKPFCAALGDGDEAEEDGVEWEVFLDAREEVEVIDVESPDSEACDGVDGGFGDDLGHVDPEEDEFDSGEE